MRHRGMKSSVERCHDRHRMDPPPGHPRGQSWNPWWTTKRSLQNATSTRQPGEPAKKAGTAKSVTQATVTLKHLAATLADSHDLPKKQAEVVLGDLVVLATKHLKRGDKIRLSGLGNLQVRKRAARMGRNPAAGESVKIKASKKIAFRPAKELKEAV